MDRRTFIHQGCLACAAAVIAPTFLSSCGSAQPIAGGLEGDDLVVPSSAFAKKDGGKKPYVVVTHAQLKQPVAVFSTSEGGYRALLMRCPHKGAELRVTGDRLECPAHGSVFTDQGAVTEGPASSPLRTFPVSERDGRIFISLKA